MQVNRLHPFPGPVSVEDLYGGLELRAAAGVERPYLVLNMVSSLDGKATLDGETRGLSSETDRAAFHRLRREVDAVMVGATTASEEGYGPIGKDEPGALAVVVSGRLNLRPDIPLLQSPDSEVVIATAADEELGGVRARVEYLRTGADLPLLLARLREERDVRAVLCEGGPTLNSHLFAAGLVDELFLTLRAAVIGGVGAPTIVAGRQLPAPVDMQPVFLAEAGGDLLTRWRRGP